MYLLSEKGILTCREAATGKELYKQRLGVEGTCYASPVVGDAVLHHLRTDDEWRKVFEAFYQALRPGGSVWIVDLVDSTIPAVRQIINQRYGEYLTKLKDARYRGEVFAYIEREDTPRPLVYQLDLLRQVGFAHVEVLHKNLCFAAFGAVKG